MNTIIWFSCGASSAIASKIAVNKYGSAGCEVVYCDTGSEHQDNKRFLKDVSGWIEKDITILKNEKYSDIWDVFNKTRYLVGHQGARCTYELKRKMREQYQKDGDVHIFGYTAEEEHRAAKFEMRYPDLKTEWILIENGIYKKDCYGMLTKAGIEIPTMYKLGYKNNNCIGCPKGGAGYWNKIRIDFPEVFEMMGKIERTLNISVIRKGKRRIFLDELPKGMGNYTGELDFDCNLMCEIASDLIKEAK